MSELENSAKEQLTGSIENMSDEVLASAIDTKVGMKFLKSILVKPLDPITVTKTLTVPEDSGEKDENGDPIMQMTIKNVDSESQFRKGVVISVPISIIDRNADSISTELVAGKTIVYNHRRSIDFDLYKDSVLVDPFDVISVVA